MVITEEYVIIINRLKDFPEGANLAHIHENLEFSVSKRTLQRRLSDLVKSGVIESIGENRGRHYKLPSIKSSHQIPLSSSALKIQSKIRQDLSKRPRVNYQRSFLDNYQPNVTYYLSTTERAQLLEWGTPYEAPNQTGTFTKRILHNFMIDLSWNSSRLEGNTYSLLETDRLLYLGEVAENKNPEETQMLLNHKAAVEFLIEQEDSLRINASTILNLHAFLSDNLLGNPASCGQIRDIPVGVAKTAYTPLAIPQLIHEMFEMIIQKAKAIQDPFEQSFFLTVHIPYLQAFEDVNKRTSRLSANIPLFQHNLCPLSFVDVPEKSYIEGLLGVYELNQTELLKDLYLWAYERSCKRYSTMQQITGAPDLIYYKHHIQIKKIIHKIITTRMNQTQAIATIEQSAALVPAEERQHFIEIIDNELMGLHQGNIARFKIKEHEYELWKKTWV